MKNVYHSAKRTDIIAHYVDKISTRNKTIYYFEKGLIKKPFSFLKHKIKPRITDVILGFMVGVKRLFLLVRDKRRYVPKIHHLRHFSLCSLALNSKTRLCLVGVPILKHNKIKSRITDVILDFMVGVKRLELLTSSL